MVDWKVQNLVALKADTMADKSALRLAATKVDNSVPSLVGPKAVQKAQ